MENIQQEQFFGFEYKSSILLFGIPLIHISFRYRKRGTGIPVPVAAKGIIAVGQVAIGVFVISQFGIGFFNISQFTISAFAITQVGLAYSLIAQVGLYNEYGIGQVVATYQEFGFFLQELLGIY